MATEVIGTACPDDGIKNVNFKCTTNLSDWQFRPVKLSGNNTVAKQTSAGGTMLGILQNAPNGSTQTVAEVKTLGFSYAYAGGTCTVDGLGTVATTDGDFVDATGSNKEAPVRFIEGTTTDGDRIIVQIIHQHKE